MKKIALMAVAALVALGSTSHADAATFGLDINTGASGNMHGGFVTYLPQGNFSDTYTFTLPKEGVLLNASTTVAMTTLSHTIDNLSLSLWEGTPGSGTALAMTSDYDTNSSPTYQHQALTFSGNLNAGSSYFLKTSGFAPTDLTMGGSLAVAPIPLPAALPLFGAALAGLGLYKRKKNKVEEAV